MILSGPRWQKKPALCEPVGSVVVRIQPPASMYWRKEFQAIVQLIEQFRFLVQWYE